MAGNGVYIAGQKIGGASPTYKLVEDTTETRTPTYNTVSSQPTSTTNLTKTTTGAYQSNLGFTAYSSWVLVDDLNFSNPTAFDRSALANATITLENAQLIYTDGSTANVDSNNVFIALYEELYTKTLDGLTLIIGNGAAWDGSISARGFTGFIKINNKYLATTSGTVNVNVTSGSGRTTINGTFTFNGVNQYGSTSTGSTTTQTSTEVISTLTNGSSLSSFSTTSSSTTETTGGQYYVWYGFFISEVTTTKVTEYANGSYTYRINGDYYLMTSKTDTAVRTQKSRRIIEE